MTWNKRAAIGVVSLAALALMSCAGTQGGGASWSKGKVPLGVSREVAARADTIADLLFVPREREKSAQVLSAQGIRHYTVTDSLWKLVEEHRRKIAQQSKPATDSTIAVTPNLAANNPAAPKGRNGTVDIVDRRMTIAASYNLLEARKNLEKARSLDPFKPLTKHNLALTYKLFAEKFPREVSFERAAEQWTDLLRLEPGEYRHYYNLATVSFAQHQWRKALRNFQQAEQLMRASAVVSQVRVDSPNLPVTAGLDSAVLFFAVYSQGQALIKDATEQRVNGRTPEADSALHHLERAKLLTADSNWHRLIDADIKYVNWDERNIWGSVLRDSANALATSAKFTQAAEIYDQLLNKVLRTQRAKDDVKWDYATIEYAKLKRRASAVARLGEVINTIAKDSSGAPVDTTYNNMFENYGAMCHYLGVDTMKVNRKVAYEYFERAAAIAWKERGKSYLNMAELTKTNIELSLKHAENAVAWERLFNTEEKKMIYRLLAEAYRRKNQPDKARLYFDKFRELQ